ncbi:MAG: S9 family peptidase [Xanthomonadales bacterium]|nr:S9 family peptidase [Xanthomonadales bacterium]
MTLVLALMLAACTQAPTSAPSPAAETAVTDTAPIARQIPHLVSSPHGERADPYYWLRDDERAKPEVLAYLEAENAWHARHMARLQPLADRLYEEIVGRIKQDDASVPYHDRGWWYYVRYEEGREYPVYARRKGTMAAPEEILLDGNAMAQDHDFFQIANYEVSDDGRWLVWAEDTVGRRQFVLRFKDLQTGQVLPYQIAGVSASLAWAADNATVFYTENDPDTLLSKRIRRHRLGTDPADDPVVYEEADDAFYIGVDRTGDHRYVLIHSSSTVSDEVRFLPADQPQGSFTVLAPRERDFEYSVDHIGERWLIRTNWQAANFRLMQVADGQTGDRGHWQEVLAHREDVFIDDFQAFTGFIAIDERSDGLRRVRVRSWDGSRDDYIGVDEPVYVAGIHVNCEQDSDWLRYHYSSPTTPGTVYELNVITGERRLLKQDPVLGGFDPGNYVTERLWAPASDGTRIPVTLLYRKGFSPDGTAALYQYGYGAYGLSMDPYFSSPRLSLVDRGVVFAIAHIRGGEEMGRHWYESGKLLNKQNSFTDFIDVTEHLVGEGYAAADRVVAMGGSAGGLLMGAVANMAPERYRALAAHVPFVDVLTTMMDTSIPLTTNEYDEWGNPEHEPDYHYIASYSPYDNISAQDYPALYITTGLWDSQVQYWEPAKWVARLRASNTGDAPILYKTNMEAGHGGKSGRFQRYRETAEEYAFMLDQLGIGD